MRKQLHITVIIQTNGMETVFECKELKYQVFSAKWIPLPHPLTPPPQDTGSKWVSVRPFHLTQEGCSLSMARPGSGSLPSGQ